MHRGSLEVGDVLSDLSANPMELSLLGVQGQCLTVAHSKAGQVQHTSAQSACAVHVRDQHVSSDMTMCSMVHWRGPGIEHYIYAYEGMHAGMQLQ